jgi:LDH2 family malate/lactate/ureidoglycolate dehydrogenase
VALRSDRDWIAISTPVATAVTTRAFTSIGFSDSEASTMADALVDAELCGYPALGLARVLTIAEHARLREPRQPPRPIRETAASALIDGGNSVGLFALSYATGIAIEKASASGFAVVGVNNSWLSGRNAYYLERIARAGLVGILTVCSRPVVAPHGGMAPALGTNPFGMALPGNPDPLVFDMGTAATNRGDLVLASRTGQRIAEGVAVDARGEATIDPEEALAGAILPFGGHKGSGLAMMMQAMGLVAGAALPYGLVQDFAFLFVVFDPTLLVPLDELKEDIAELIARVKATPRQPGIDEIRVPSERAFAERDLRRDAGVRVNREIYDAIVAL